MSTQLVVCLLTGAIVFSIGLLGSLIRRNAIMILLSIELMLNAINLNFLAFARFCAAPQGEVFVICIIGTAVAVTVVALACLTAICRTVGTEHVDEFATMKR